MNYVVWLLLAIIILASSEAFAVEPQASPEELPRIAPTEPGEALATFQLHSDYRLELAAAEPLVVDPIAMAFDARGRLFVVEMRGYSERREEALGRVRLLTDADGDGRFESSQIYADGLKWPTGIACYKDGVYVIATPDLHYFKDTNNDGVADERQVVFTGFGEGQSRLNVQALANSLHWGIDLRFHGATAANGALLRRPDENEGSHLTLRGRDFSWDPASLSLRPEVGGGQFGISYDRWGNKFLCSNSHHAQYGMYRLRYGAKSSNAPLPNPLVDIAREGPTAEVFRISQDEPWRLVRTRWRVEGQVPGPVEGGGRVSGYFTSAASIFLHEGEQPPQADEGHLFVADVGSNLVHRKVLDWHSGVQPIAARPKDEDSSEFLASRDNWFRPVCFATGPDGALYIADMYREVIEHPWSLPEGLKKHLDLNAGHDRGRIYRVVPRDFSQPSLTDLSSASAEQLIASLAHPNSWHRLTASRLLYERLDTSLTDGLRELTTPPVAHLHALHLLSALGGLREEDYQRGLNSPEANVRIHAIQLAESNPAGTAALTKAWDKLTRDPSPRVRFQVLLTLSLWPDNIDENLSWLAAAGLNDPWLRHAFAHAAGDRAPQLLAQMLRNGQGQPELLENLARLAARANPSKAMWESLPTLALKVAYLQGAGTIGDLLDTGTLLKLKHDAEAVLKDLTQSSTAHQRAIDLLALFPPEQVHQTFLATLRETKVDALASRIINALKDHPALDVSEQFLGRWTSFSVQTQSAIADLCLSHGPWTSELLTVIEDGTIPRTLLTGAQVRSLQNHGDPHIRQQARRLYAPKTRAEREAVVREFLPALTLNGNPDKGQITYTQRCASCHDPGDSGQSLGPLRATLTKTGKERLLVNIVDPNREVAPNYMISIATLESGEAVAGILAADSGDAITIRQPFGVERMLKRNQITKLDTLEQSVMTESLEVGLTAQDMADLLAFLITSG